jgi:gluconolactonase
MTEMQLLTDRLHFPEGPIAISDGSVIVVEIQTGKLTRVAADGTLTEVADTGGGPNGAAVGPDGKIYVCNNGGFEWSVIDGMVSPGPEPADYIGGRIQRVDPQSGAVEDVYTECNGNKLRGPNDIVFDDQGGFYFTDLGKSRARTIDRAGVYYAKADGSQITELVYGLDHLNGISLSPDGTRLYAVETITSRVWFWDIQSPGKLAPPKTPYASGDVLANLPGWQLVDSIAVDSEGNICVATLMTGAISVFSPSGELLNQIKVPEKDIWVTNICFGGADMRTAYITSSGLGRLYSMQWHCPGLRLHHNL